MYIQCILFSVKTYMIPNTTFLFERYEGLVRCGKMAIKVTKDWTIKQRRDTRADTLNVVHVKILAIHHNELSEMLVSRVTNATGDERCKEIGLQQ